jgi:hypothetical protein
VLSYNKAIAKAIRSIIGQKAFPKIEVGVGESLKDQVYGKVVEEIEAFCEKYGVMLGSRGVDLVFG